MARSSATLSTQLQAVVPTMASGSLALATAYGEYMKGATALTPIIAAAVPTAVTAMSGAMTFTAGATAAAGGAVLQAGVAAFWAAMAAAPVSFFATATVITPPPAIASLGANLAPVLTSNTASGTTQAAASDALAAVFHTASTGGTVTTPVAVVTPIL